MPRPRLRIVSHLSHTELLQHYETCCEDKVKVYWLTIYLLNQPEPFLSVEQVADTVQFSTDWVRKLAHRYNRFGPAALTGHFQRRRNPRSHLSPIHPPKLGNLLPPVDACSAPVAPKFP